MNINYHVRYNRTTNNGVKRLYMRVFESETTAKDYARRKAKDTRNADIRAFQHTEFDGVTYVDTLTF